MKIDMEEIVFTPADFVAAINQTLEFAYPSVSIQGELANLRVSKNRWVYFDLKDNLASVKFFGTIHQLPGPLEDGMLAQVRGLPRLHQQYGFSVNVQFMRPVGEGSIKKAAALLEAKLAAEGLFDDQRKRTLPYPPRRVGLIASGESAAYHDFMKVLNHRWAGVEVLHADVQVQGELAVGQITAALEQFNTHGDDVDVLILTRGGGSPEDLSAFSTEQVTRAVAASRIPTLVAIGHEVDISLAELAADQRASTPSNAAELLVPDKKEVVASLQRYKTGLHQGMKNLITTQTDTIQGQTLEMGNILHNMFVQAGRGLRLKHEILEALSPEAALKRGYAVIRSGLVIIKSAKQVKPGQSIDISVQDGNFKAEVQ